MKHPRWPAALVLLAAIPALACGSREDPADPADIILANVVVIDGLGGAPVPAQTVAIREGRISEIRDSGPQDAQAMDLTGHYLIPGLIDSHMHLGQNAGTLGPILDSLLRGGITAVREMACCADLYQPLDSEADSVRSPRLYASAFWADPVFFVKDPRVSSTPSAGALPWFLGVTDSTDLEGAVRDARAGGATGIKIYSNLPGGLIGAIVTEAHRQGMRAWSHPVVFPTRPSQVIAAGVDVISHAALLVWEGADTLPSRYNAFEPFNPFGPPAPYESVPPNAPQVLRVLETMRDRGVILDATVSTIAAAVSEEASAWAVRVTALAHGMGIAIAAGTDRQHFVDGYPALFAELDALVGDVGLTPLEALTTATRNGARVLGVDDRLGTIEVGKLADLVVLRNDPSRDIANARDVAYVIKGGRLLPK